jgi:hypothetical protein
MGIPSPKVDADARSPGELLPHHAALIAASAICDAVRDARGYYSATDSSELRALGFSAAQATTPALVLPIHGTGGSIVGTTPNSTPIAHVSSHPGTCASDAVGAR